MKKVLILALFIVTIVFTGCNETPRVYYNSDYYGEPIKVTDNLYFKQVRIQDVKVLLQCDKDGNIIHGQNINSGYKDGKVSVNTAVINLKNLNESVDVKYNFKCSDINDCCNQVIVVKNSLIK